MKTILAVVSLLGLLSCNEHVSTALKKSSAEKLTCQGGGTSRRAIVIDEKNIELVREDMMNRETERKSFWARLSRDTRISLNLLLNSQIGDLDETVVYKGAAMFFEKYPSDRTLNLVLNYNGKTMAFRDDHSPSTTVEPGCSEVVRDLQEIKVDRLIPASTLQAKLNCEVNQEKFALQIYKSSVVIVYGEENYSFTGGEAIRTDSESALTVVGLDPREQKLNLTLNRKTNAVKIDLAGINRSLSGTGSCL